MSVLGEAFGREFRPHLHRTGRLFHDRKEGPIYHYTSPEGLLSILKNKTLWFTDIMGLNDASEGNYIWEIIDECLDSSYDDKFITSVQGLGSSPIAKSSEKEGIEDKAYFVCSFSEDSDSLSMWNYYTKNASSVGYNICFDRQQLKNIVKEWENKFEVKLFKVLYDKEEQTKWVKDTLNLVYKYWQKCRAKKRQQLLWTLESLINYVKIGFKHPSFKNEQEIRLVIELTAEQFSNNFTVEPEEKEVGVRIVNNTFVPYLEVPFNNVTVVKGVTASPIIKDENAIDSIYLLLYKYGYQGSCQVEVSNVPLKY